MKNLTVKELREILNNIPTKHDDVEIVLTHTTYENGEPTFGVGVCCHFAEITESIDEEGNDVLIFEMENGE